MDQATVTWIDQNGVGSFEVRVEELGAITSIVDAEVVPGTVRQRTLGGLSLRGATQYRAVVLSHSHDVFTPIAFGGQFNMAYDLWLFTIGGGSPNAQGAQRRLFAPPVAHRVP